MLIKIIKTVSLTSPPFFVLQLSVIFPVQDFLHIVIEKIRNGNLKLFAWNGTCANSVGKVQFLNNCLTISFQNVNLNSAFKSAYILNKEHRKKLQFSFRQN